MDALWAALLVAIPATVTALAAWRAAASANKSVRTSNGLTIGQLAEQNVIQLDKLAGAFNQHCEEAWRRFDSLEARAHDHDDVAP